MSINDVIRKVIEQGQAQWYIRHQNSNINRNLGNKLVDH